MSFLYICEPDTTLHIDDGRIVAENKNEMQTSIPFEQLEGVVLMGRAGVSSNCATELLKKGIPVTYLSSTGKYFGRLESTGHVNIVRQRLQFKRGEDYNFKLEFAKSIVLCKMHNQAIMLKRYNRYKNNDDVNINANKIEVLSHEMGKADSIEKVMGYEGSASRVYFEGISMIVNPEFAFKGRNRMPPLDPFNSALSFGYTLLMYEIYTAIVSKGLNPYAGFMHSDRQNHPTLASDLMEEWRPVIVDSLVINLLNNNILKPEDFRKNEETGGILFNKDGSKRFIREFENKLRTEASYLTYIDSRISFRRAIQSQVGVLAKSIEEDDISLYKPIKIR